MRIRFVPPAGTPIALGQIFGAAFSSLGSPASDHTKFAPIVEFLGVKHIFATSSARASLYVTLKALQRLRPDRNTVAVPAFTCYSVAAAIVKANLKIRPVEIEPKTLDLDVLALERAPAKDLLCVLTANMFGMPSDVARIVESMHPKNVFVLDDAAQALGATVNGHRAGTTADVGVYSLGRGKALPAWEGGLIVTNDEHIGRALTSELKNVEPASWLHSVSVLAKMMAYSVLLRPSLYWIPNSAPFLNLGITEYNPDFPINGLPPICLELLNRSIKSLPAINGARAKMAQAIASNLAQDQRYRVLRPRANTKASHIRIGVMAETQSLRNHAVAALNSAGYGASAFYPTAICDIPGIADHMASSGIHCPVAEDVSKRIFTLPSHPYVNENDKNRMIQILLGLKNV